MDNFVNENQFYKHKNNEIKRIRYNIPKNHINRFFKIDDEFIEYPSKTSEKDPNRLILDMGAQVYMKKYDEKLLELQEEINNLDDFFLKQNYLSQIPEHKNLIIENSLHKTKQFLRQKIFELNLYKYLVNLKDCNLQNSLSDEIDNIFVLNINDMKESDFVDINNECCLKIPLLVSSGNMMDVDDFFSKTSIDSFEWVDNKKMAINKDFVISSYINRFISVLANMGMNKIHMVHYKIRPKNKPYTEVEFLIIDDEKNKEDDLMYEQLVVRMNPNHFEKILIPFLIENNMWDDEKKMFQPNENLKFNNFPILNYRQFKMIFQTASSYDKKEPHLTMYKPITNVKNAFTIDLIDFEDFKDSYETHSVDFYDMKPQEKIKKDNHSIIYSINDRLYIQNIGVRDLISRILSKTENDFANDPIQLK